MGSMFYFLEIIAPAYLIRTGFAVRNCVNIQFFNKMQFFYLPAPQL